MRVKAPRAETIVACLTPAGAGAIATLALRGPRAWDVVRQLFRSHSQAQPRLPLQADIGPVWLGRLGEEAGDEVVVSVRSVEPVAWVEVHCHGGREVIGLLMEGFAAHGVRSCSWQEFQREAISDPLSAAAAGALANAPTARTAGILLDQYHGTFSRIINNILASWDHGDLDEGARLLQSLVSYAGVGRHLTAAWRLVVAGAPNVGKSSLMNALAGYPRCVVAPTPGTTRDLVATHIAVDGWPIELTDTAGLRAAMGVIEQEGIDRARTAIRAADLCLWVLDASAPPVWPDLQTDTMRLVINKVDLGAAWNLDQAAPAVRVSALCGTGLAGLCDAVAQWLVPAPPPAGAAVPFTAHLSTQVEQAWQHSTAGRIEEARRVLAEMIQGQDGEEEEEDNCVCFPTNE